MSGYGADGPKAMACVDSEAHVLIHGTLSGKMRDAALSADMGKTLSVIVPLSRQKHWPTFLRCKREL